MAVPILLYHSVSDEATPEFRRWVVDPGRFAEQMGLLAEGGYRAITVSEYVRCMLGESELCDKPVVITFDDGFADFRTTALPILREFGLRSTLYLTTAYLDGTSRWLAPAGEPSRPMLKWSDVVAVAGDNVEIGAHGHTHRQLDTVALGDAVEDIERSKTLLETRLGVEIRTLAYPYGYSTRALRREVEAMGFTSACGVKHALSSLRDDRFTLARVIVGHDVDRIDFERLLGGHGLRIAPPTATLPALGWRWYRRIRRSGRWARAGVSL